MSTTITIEPNEALTALLGRLRDLPDLGLRAVAAGMGNAGETVLGAAKFSRFRGKGPFPVSDHRLGIVTNLLNKSLRVTAPAIEDGKLRVFQRFGSNVSYFAAHEFGFRGSVVVKAHERQLRARRNRKAGKPSNGKIPVVARGEVTYVKSHTRNMVIQARAPLGTELASRRTWETYSTEISKQLRQALTTQPGGNDLA